MSSGRLVLSQDGPIATVRIANEPKRNAMTTAMWRALPGLLARAASDPSVRVLLLTGAGPTFCAGADIAEAADLARAGASSPVIAAEEALATFPKPTVARIEGFCVGGGCQLAVACDLRLAADDARFGITPAKLGIVYPPSSTRRLAALLGPARAKLLLYTGDLIDAAAAERIGLIDAVVPPADLDAAVAHLATTLAARSALTQRAAKAALLGLDQPAQDEKELTEGVSAFLERRAARFTWM